MNRLLLVGNAILALVLISLITHYGQPAAAREMPVLLAVDELRAVVQGADRRRVILDFGTEMVPLEAVGSEPRVVGVAIEPAVEVLGSWRNTRQLLLQTSRPLPVATLHSLHLVEEFPAVNGRRAPAGLRVEFETKRPGLAWAVFDSRQGTDFSLLLGFNMDLGEGSLKEHLRLMAPRGNTISATVREAGIEGEHLYRVEFTWPVVTDFVELWIGEGLSSAVGSLPMGRTVKRRVKLGEPLEWVSASAGEGRIRLSFNRPIPLPAAAELRLEPDLPFQVRRHGRGIDLIGDFEPGTVIGVQLPAGFPGDGEAFLRRAHRRSLLIPDRRPELDFAQPGSVLSALAEPELEIRGVNVQAFGISLRRLYPNNALRMFQSHWREDLLFAPEVERTFEVTVERNSEFRRRINLEEILGQDLRGLFSVRLWDPQAEAYRARRIIQVTDVGVTVRSSGDGLAVQVVSLARGGPVGDAEIEVITGANQVLTRGTTNAKGVALFRVVGPAKPQLVHVQVGDDHAFVDLDGYRVELSDASLSGRPYLQSGYEAFVHPSRGIVRPGERIEATVLVRDAAGRAPAGLRMQALFEAPGSRVWRRARVELGGSGLSTVQLDLPPSAPTGAWRVKILDADTGEGLGAAAFLVRAFVPDRLEAEIEAIATVRFGDTAEIRVRANWLDGTPAAGRPVRLEARFDHGVFRPVDFPEYSFGGGDLGAPPGARPALQGVLGGDGTAVLRLAVPATAASQTLRGQFRLEVMDPSGRAVHGVSTAPVLRRDGHLGLRADGEGIDLVMVDADGAVLPGDEVVIVDLEERYWEWHTVKRRGSGWRYQTVRSAVVLETRQVTLVEGRARLEFSESRDHGGWLVAVARCGERRAEQALGTVPRRPDRLRVTSPEKPVAPGGFGRIQVDSPAAGRGLLTLEGGGIHSVQVLQLERGSNDIDVPIPVGLRVPNLHAVVTLTRPLARGGDAGPFWLIGGAAIRLQRDDMETRVTIHAPDEVLPEAVLVLDVHAPSATRVTVAVVDEGVLNLTRHRDPDPLGHFLARRRLDARGADMGAHLFAGHQFAPGVGTGGDGDAVQNVLLAGSINTRIRPLALFRDSVVLDAAGRARVRLALPAYEGRVRAVVIASGPRVAGAASHAIAVRAPLGLQTAMPRMMVPGDLTELPITVANHTGVAGTAEISLTDVEGLVLAPGQALIEVPLDAGAVQTVRIPLRAGALGGLQSVRVTARLGSETRSVEATVLVREPATPSSEFIGLVLEGQQEIRIPEDFLTEHLEVSLRVDSAPDLQLRPALESLLGYPYGCLEQTTSKCMGLLSCNALLPGMYRGEENDLPPDTARLMQAGVDRIFSMQLPRGGFAWWPMSTREYAFGTVHALDFLLAAGAQGVLMPETGLQRALDRLARIVASSDDIGLRCHGIEVLSRAGRPTQPWLDFLADAAVLGEDRIRVAMALARGGRVEQAAAMLAPTESEEELEVDDMLRSPWRHRALELRARLLIDPENTGNAELALQLTRAIARPALRTTQDKAQILRALSEYYAVLPSTDEAFTVTVATSIGTWQVVDSSTLQLPPLVGEPYRIESSQRVFGYLSLRGLRRGGAPNAPGLEFTRSYIDLETGEPTAEFKSGRIYEVVLSGHARQPLRHAAFTDLLPGGFELEEPRPGDIESDNENLLRPSHVERRDDRVIMFYSGTVQGDFELRYRVRAVFPGRYAQPAFTVEAMYDPHLRYRLEIPAVVEVRR